MKENSIFVNSEKNNKETIANTYALKCLTCAMVVLGIILVLNVINVFLVDKTVTIRCVGLCFVVYCATISVRLFVDLSKSWVKYYILFGEVAWITIIATSLTYHALLACALPILSSSVYASKRVAIYTYVLMVISTCISVFAGYHLGICDANMVLLTGHPLGNYVSDSGEFSHNEINDDLFRTLSLFFVLPRSMILLAFAIITSNISKILNLNMDYARKMENMAEIDGMTGLFNKSKYLDMIKEYKKEDKVGLIFWDINFLKRINDSKGHEFGDELIRIVAKSILANVEGANSAYRIGGDEFVMVVPNGEKQDIEGIIEKWRRDLRHLEKKVEFDVSVAVGYAWGNGVDYDEIIRRADQMMYVDKSNKIRCE